MKNITTTLTALFLALGATTSAQPGNLDDTFGTDGKVTTAFGTVNDIGKSVALQLDGKIVVAGSTFNVTDTDFALARFNADGTLDNSFSLIGKVTTAFGTGYDQGRSVAIQPDGQIVVAGYAYSGLSNDFALARYNTDGTLDNSFSVDGKVTTDFGTGSVQPNDYGTSLSIQSDGKILVAGYSYNGTDVDFALARYNTDGTPDSSFSADGKLTTDFGMGDDYGTSVAIQSDGKILVAGYASNGTDVDLALARYNTDGTLDNSFSADGKANTDFGAGDDYGTSVAIQSDGMILVAGSSNGDFALARYNMDGSLDNSFSVDGKVTTDFGTGDDYGESVAIQPDGKILVAGSASNGTDKDFALARYNTDGTLDNSLSLDGKLVTAYGAGDDYGRSVTVQPDGRVVVAGDANNGTDGDVALARYNMDGTLDNSFSVDGKVTTDFGTVIDKGYSVAIQPDGKIVVAGSSGYNFALARYSMDGTLDNSFGVDGRVNTYFGGWQFGNSVSIQPDGQIVVAGYIFDGTNRDFAVARYNMEGTLDNSFSMDGIVTTDFGSGEDFGKSVAIQPDGKILVAGSSNNGTDDDFAVARYNTDGTLDNSFGVGGKVTTAIGTSDDRGWSLAIQPDGKIVVAGESYDGLLYDFALVRYNTNGSLDNGFGVDGKLTTCSSPLTYRTRLWSQNHKPCYHERAQEVQQRREVADRTRGRRARGQGHLG
jgi:uncharacterized delta-60 repeat protein